MLTPLAKFLAYLRLDNDETVNDMAKGLGTTAGAIQRAEVAGTLPTDLYCKISKTYYLSGEKQEELYQLQYKAIKILKLDLRHENEKRKGRISFIALTLQQLKDEELEELANCLKDIKNKK